jgi:VanZ family protein
VYALFWIVVALIVYGTLYPFHFNFAARHGNAFLILLHSWPARFGPSELRDAVLNVALFVPLGATACLAVAKRHGRAAGYAFALATGAALSASVEMLQIYDSHRYCSALDWLCNTTGTFLGAALAVVFQPRIERLTTVAARRGAPAALLLAGCWTGFQLYPLIPQFNRGHLQAAWAHLTATPLSAVEIFASAAGWFVFALTLRTVWPRMPAAGLALAMLSIPLRLFITDRSLDGSDLLGGALGLVLWVVTPGKARQGAAWLLLFAAIIVRELAPFRFGAFHPFSWRPLAASLGAPTAAAAAVVFRKAFEYGAAIWLLRLNNVGYLPAGIAVAAALGAMETLQCFLPGRQPEITDPLIALLMALVLSLLNRGR